MAFVLVFSCVLVVCYSTHMEKCLTPFTLFKSAQRPLGSLLTVLRCNLPILLLPLLCLFSSVALISLLPYSLKMPSSSPQRKKERKKNKNAADSKMPSTKRHIPILGFIKCEEMFIIALMESCLLCISPPSPECKPLRVGILAVL